MSLRLRCRSFRVSARGLPRYHLEYAGTLPLRRAYFPDGRDVLDMINTRAESGHRCNGLSRTDLLARLSGLSSVVVLAGRPSAYRRWRDFQPREPHPMSHAVPLSMRRCLRVLLPTERPASADRCRHYSQRCAGVSRPPAMTRPTGACASRSPEAYVTRITGRTRGTKWACGVFSACETNGARRAYFIDSHDDRAREKDHAHNNHPQRRWSTQGFSHQPEPELENSSNNYKNRTGRGQETQYRETPVIAIPRRVS
jgi:hypothetical protein